MTQEHKPPAIKHTTKHILETFEDDDIGVSHIADVIEFVIGNLESQPFVVGLSSRWGTGKTEFLRMWAKRLDERGFAFISFNFWENDFLDDPLLCLLGELSREFETGKKAYLPSWQGVKAAAGFLVKKSIPGVLKHVTMGALDAGGIGEAIGEGAEKAAEQAMESHSRIKNALSDFRNQLAGLAIKVKTETGHPLLILVDELDRCRPSFAIEMLEVIKHLFEVENVVFVLAYDGEQLACATQAVYGPRFDGTGYLQRFFNIELTLPRDPGTFLAAEASRMGLDGWIQATSNQKRYCGTGADVINTLKALAIVHQFDLRTTQRVLTRLSVVLAGWGTEKHLYAWMLAPAVVASIIAPHLLRDYLSGETDSSKLIDTIWPKVKMKHLFPGHNEDSSLGWAYGNSLFFFRYVDSDWHGRSDRGPSNEQLDEFLKSREGTPGYDRLVDIFSHKKVHHDNNHWGRSVKNTLKDLIEGSSNVFSASSGS